MARLTLAFLSIPARRRMQLAFPLSLALVAISLPATAQLVEPARAIIRSSTVEGTSVTVYRSPDRSVSRELNLDALDGYALITETRTITLPQGPATIRFEGVANGMIAVSALVIGLPGGVVEKNREGALLSPASLLDGSLGNRVTLRRINRATGAVVEQNATVRTGAGGALVFETSAGLEALRCSGLNETIVYTEIPSGLGATPVLTVDTVSPVATTATVRLTYLSTGFDWSADYILRVADDSDRVDLFGWMTIANGNQASFVDAQVMSIAGQPNIDSDVEDLAGSPPEPELQLRCYPLDGTSTAPAFGLPANAAAMSQPDEWGDQDTMDIVVTARRREQSLQDVPTAISAVTATEEGLGNLRLFRIPFPTTVAAQSQKQVAFLNVGNIRTRRIYQGWARSNWHFNDPEPLTISLRINNRRADGLGRSLAAGNMAIFSAAGRLIGSDSQRDLAVGEEFDIEVSDSPNATLTTYQLEPLPGTNRDRRQVIVHNSNNFAITAEISLGDFDEEEWQPEQRQRRHISVIRGDRTWRRRVPAHGNVTLEMVELPDN